MKTERGLVLEHLQEVWGWLDPQLCLHQVLVMHFPNPSTEATEAKGS